MLFRIACSTAELHGVEDLLDAGRDLVHQFLIASQLFLSKVMENPVDRFMPEYLFLATGGDREMLNRRHEPDLILHVICPADAAVRMRQAVVKDNADLMATKFKGRWNVRPIHQHRFFLHVHLLPPANVVELSDFYSQTTPIWRPMFFIEFFWKFPIVPQSDITARCHMADQLFFERFIWFDAQVRKGKYPSAARLAEKFEISAKTAQRSIDYFRDRLLAPLEYDPSLKGYYYYDNDFELPLMKLTEGELMSLLISKKLLSEASVGKLGEELSVVANKLGGLLYAHMPGTVDPEQAFSFRWSQFYPGDSDNFRLVSTALLNCRCLSICYQSPNSPECTQRDIEPHQMVNYMGTWHVIAWCRLRNDWRDFVLSRISSANLEDEVFDHKPQEEWLPHLTETFGIFQNRDCYDVVLQFTPERSRWIRGQIWHPEQKLEELEDGSCRLTVPVSHHAEIIMQILSHGAEVRVIEPEWLRKKVAGVIERMAALY